jgi:hypothetical protein
MRPSFTQAPLSTSDTIQIKSDGADTRNVTVETRKADGTIAASSATALNGTTPVDLTSLSTNNERVLEAIAATLSSTRTITVLLKNGGSPIVIGTIPPDEKGFALMFYDSASDPSSTRVFYELLYWYNNHATLALLAAVAQISADLSSPNAGVLKQGINTAKGNIGSALTNRLTVPGGITFVGATVDQSVPTTFLGPTEKIGVYFELTRAGGAGVIRDFFNARMQGVTV